MARMIPEEFRAREGILALEHRKAIMAELAASPHLQVRQLDATVGQLLAPTGRLRRRVLFGMSKRAARRDERRGDLVR
jgi:hypothetical protein